jgi:RNA polymerase sigma-70 factor (ECF subfamily)
MSDTSTTVDFEHLLAHREWVRAVARSLAYDAATADDLEQETWLEALRAPPGDARNLRGWLGRVLRNRARKRARSGARRATHESRAERSGTSPATADVVTEAEAQQRVVQAVLELDEPYRTTILLRFYEGLPPREIAVRMSVPPETVRTRVRRAGARLRESLGGEGFFGWTAVVIPLIGVVESSATAATAAGGALAVETKKTFVLATLAGIFIGGFCALVMSVPFSPPPAGAAPAIAETAATVADGRSVDADAALPRREHVTPPRPPEPVATADAEQTEDVTAPHPENVAADPPPPPPPEVSKRDLKKKDEKSKMAEARERVRETYEGEKKGGFTFYDLAYWVDAKKLDDSRWKKRPIDEPRHDRGLQLHARWENPASAAPGMTIDVRVLKLPHSEVQDGQRVTFSTAFDNLGETVENVDVKKLTHAFYEDWVRGARDVVESQCVRPRKSKAKVPKLYAVAVGTEGEPGERVRREWHVWSDGKHEATYVVALRFGPALLGREELLDKGFEFMKQLKALKDKRVEWPR